MAAPNPPQLGSAPQPRSDPQPGALAGLRVLELGEWVAAPWCAKLLGDLGADVVKVERPGSGDPARLRGPFPDDVPHPERSALFLYLNTSKRSVEVDLATDAGRERFRELLDGVDVLVEDRRPGELEALGLGPATLAEDDPRLVITSITPFGQTGPNRGHRSQPLNLYHAAGHASPFQPADPDAARAPARAGGYLGEYDAGLTAAVGTLAAVYARESTGRGQHVDCSKQEAMMCLERVTIGRYANEPDPFSGRRGPGGLIRAKDGFVMVTTLEPHQFDGLVRAMGEPEWAQADWCRDPAQRMARADEIESYVAAWAGQHTRDEIYRLAQGEGTPAGPVRDVAEVFGWQQATARGFFRALDHPDAGRQRYPTAPFQTTETAWVGSRAPLLGEHDDDAQPARVSHATSVQTARSTPPPEAAASAPPGPLAGIRVADFTWAWAGPQGSLLLSMLGAEVIKIESRARLDHSRVHSLTAGSLQGGIDASPIFNDLNLGKRSLTLDLRKEESRDLVRRLVADSDVVLQNMRPGVLDRMGLGYDDLRKVRPDVVMLSSSAVGATGPERTYAGYAPTFACLSGIVSISGHPDEPPMALSGSVDLRVGTASAFAVLAALAHRRRTGRGQHIDLSSTEVMSAMMGDAFVGYELTGCVPERQGNRDDAMAPHGCYRSAEPGAWMSIAVASEDEWRALVALAGDPALEVEDFATRALRWQSQDRLDPLVERFTASLAPDVAVERLQRAGIAAARVHSGATLARDPHVEAREVYQTVVHPLLGATRVVRPPWRLEGAAVRAPAPLLGQHNGYVLGEILGLDDAEIARLVEDEVVY